VKRLLHFYRSCRCARIPALTLAGWFLSGAVVAALSVPDWILAKPQAHLVILTLDAGLGDANGGLNFNGHHDGSHRIMVPLGWTVIVRMRNADTRVPHSALVTRVFRQAEMPERLSPSDAAFPGAATPVPFTGTASGGYGEFSFAADRPGQYTLACGVQTHLQAGMWLRLDIVEGAPAPDWRED